MLQILFKKGVPLLMPNKSGARGIHTAASKGHVAVVNSLIVKGENVDAATNVNIISELEKLVTSAKIFLSGQLHRPPSGCGVRQVLCGGGSVGSRGSGPHQRRKDWRGSSSYRLQD